MHTSDKTCWIVRICLWPAYRCSRMSSIGGGAQRGHQRSQIECSVRVVEAACNHQRGPEAVEDVVGFRKLSAKELNRLPGWHARLARGRMGCKCRDDLCPARRQRDAAHILDKRLCRLLKVVVPLSWETRPVSGFKLLYGVVAGHALNKQLGQLRFADSSLDQVCEQDSEWGAVGHEILAVGRLAQSSCPFAVPGLA